MDKVSLAPDVSPSWRFVIATSETWCAMIFLFLEKANYLINQDDKSLTYLS